MTNVYLLIFEPSGVSRESLLKFLSERPEVSNWHAGVPSNMVAIATTLPVNEVRDMVKGAGGLSLYLLIKADPSRFNVEITGWLQQATWDFISKNGLPAPAPPPTATPAAVQS